MNRTKPFSISKWKVQEAWQRVKGNGGSAGIDKMSIDAFELDLKKNLYKIWNRLSSGTYFPPPVKRVEIPKSDGKMRPLGIPTVGDRVAQMAVKLEIESQWDSEFHPSSFGYRMGKSAHDAIAQARSNCHKHKWVIDLDIKGFFDNIDHTLMLKAIDKQNPPKWVRLALVRWLKADVMYPDGS
ncbi:reverse transcriptase domain-containing protein, partial [Thorsellia kenyensis]